IFLFLLPFLFAIAFISCKNDTNKPSEPNTPPPSDGLTGQSTIPNNPLIVEDVDDSVWIGTDSSNAEIAYIAPADDVSINKLQMISIGPGADCSKEMTINWHSPVPVNYVEFTTADDTSFSKAGKVWVEGKLTEGNFEDTDAKDNTKQKKYGWNDGSGKLDNTKFYFCKADLKKLKPNTDYIYRVGTGNSSEISKTFKFKTAGTKGGQFSFFWAADLHTPSGSSSYIKRISELIGFANANLKKADLPEVDYVLFTGDLVEAGAVYQDWLYWDAIPEIKDYMWATTTGNHDYYLYDGYRGLSGKARVSPRWQYECTAFPSTNTYKTSDGTVKTLDPSNYWYLYNRVLFIGIDSMSEESVDSKYKESLSTQKAWFKAVVEENKGKYDYIIAFQHYAYLVCDEEVWGHYADWRKIFDSVGVDFALGSDSHSYSRTYEIVKSQKIASDANGTVYVTSPMTEGGSLSAISNEYPNGKGKFEFYGGGCVGGCYFVVNSNSITMYLIGAKGRVFDQKTVGKKKREWN
nr:metallophosphoesterase [Treponema sp.]